MGSKWGRRGEGAREHLQAKVGALLFRSASSSSESESLSALAVGGSLLTGSSPLLLLPSSERSSRGSVLGAESEACTSFS